MKPVFLLTRFLTGALFVFSGIVKLNDPSGFAIKLNEYFDVFSQDLATTQDSVRITLTLDGKHTVFKNVALFANDSEKELSIAIAADTLKPLSVELNWGGYIEDFELEGLHKLPQFYQTTVALIGTKIQDKPESVAFRYTLDSGTSDTKNVNLLNKVNVKPWIKAPSITSEVFKGMKPYALHFSLFFCALEVWLGLALLLGYQIKITLGITTILIVFFTFLTGYSAYFDKVTDCGCFGDFIKLKPWDSFKKDIVLSVMVIILWIGVKYNKSVFVKGKDHLVLGLAAILIFLFGFWCYVYLPIWDFLPYKKGNDIKYLMEHIPEGERASDSIEVKFVMQKGSDSIKVSTLEFAKAVEKGYTFVRQDRKIIIEGYKSPIHDFAIYDLSTGQDLKDVILNDTGYKVLWVMPFLSETHTPSLEKAKVLFNWCQKLKIPFYALSSASLEPANAFVKKHDLPFNIYAADQKMLMTMARYNPTYFVFKGSTVIEKSSGRSTVNINALNELCKP